MNQPDKKKVVFLYPGDSLQPWARRDLQILKKHFKVSTSLGLLPGLFSGGKWQAFLAYRFGMSLLLHHLQLFNEIIKADLTFAWFADRRAILSILASRLLGKGSIAVVGGFDIDSEPDIGYGRMRHTLARKFVSFGLKRADLVLPFSEYAAEKVKGLTGEQTNIRAVNLACDTDRFKPGGPKENIVITAGLVDKENVVRKGFKTFVAAARHLPQVKFYLIGRQWGEAINELRAMATANVEFPGFLSDDELVVMYQKTRVFCLLSYLEGEGGGGVLGEAMACGCIPVVSSQATALRETVGDCGFYVPYSDPEATAGAIKKALDAPAESGKKARKRIEELYSMEKRETELLNAIEEVLNDNGKE